MDMGLILLSKVTKGAQNRIGCALAQRAEGRLFHLLSELFKELDVSLAASPPADPPENFLHPFGLDPAIGTFSTNLAQAKIDKIAGHLHHAGLIIRYDHAARAHASAELRNSVIVDGGVEMLRGNKTAGQSP